MRLWLSSILPNLPMTTFGRPPRTLSRRVFTTWKWTWLDFVLWNILCTFNLLVHHLLATDQYYWHGMIFLLGRFSCFFFHFKGHPGSAPLILSHDGKDSNEAVFAVEATALPGAINWHRNVGRVIFWHSFGAGLLRWRSCYSMDSGLYSLQVVLIGWCRKGNR